jgi:hypothetical protein
LIDVYLGIHFSLLASILAVISSFICSWSALIFLTLASVCAWFVFIPSFRYYWPDLISSLLIFISVRKRGIICYTCILWSYIDQDPMHFPIQPHLTLDITCRCDYRWDSDWWVDLLVVTRNNYSTIADFHTLQIITR